MKLRLIQPAQLDEQGRPCKYHKLFMPFSTLATLAGLTPSGVEVGITDDYVEEIDFDEKGLDLVGVTAQTCHSPRAYQIASEFRRRGVKTLMGGIHATACPEEALDHFDTVVVGEVEDLWVQIIADARAGTLQRIYRCETKPDLSRLVLPRYDLIDFTNYVIPPFARTPLISIQTTRGCPFSCDFCSVTRFFGNGIRTKPVANVIREIEAVNPSRIFFADDNIIANPTHARALFAALTPLRTRWCCQMSTTVLRHPDLIERAAESGCHESLIGIESLNEDSLGSVHKSFNKVQEYAELFRIQKEVGILGQAAILFGLDYDTPDNLRRAVDTILTWDINYLYISILTPLPGTPVFARLTEEGRIRNPDRSLYDCQHLVIQPKMITPEQLFDIVWETYDTFYSYGNIARRAMHFGKQYVRFFPRDLAVEEIFFQIHMRNSVKGKHHPFCLGLRRKASA